MSKNNKLLIQELCAISIKALKNKVRISPIGEVTGIDGRFFKIDGEALLKDLQKNGLELPLSKNHDTYSTDAEALGWFSDFELQEKGIYAKLELNEKGADLVARKAFKYLSPEYFIDWDTKEVFNLNGVGLVMKPNVLNEALNEAQQPPKEGNTTMNEQDKKKFEKLEASNNTLEQDKAALEKDNQALQVQVNTQSIDAAIANNALLPAKKDYALTLDANGLKHFLKTEADTMPKPADNTLDPDGSDGAVSDIHRQLGLGEDQD